ncbi:MAG: class I SAM-dependent methyltransferase [Defluviitaleaceae bacterium]|nr:class I SAM-dependent methyltransferase [Defluviitaleaceae bacterium]
MECYKGFAAVYDTFMVRDIPYDAWADYICEIINNLDKCEIILDLACGTGNMTLRLAERGYDMIGTDASEDMLALAQDKAFEADRRVLWLAQDMRALDLYGTVDAVTCVCDGMNYILESDELKEVFKRVRLFLNPGGVFIFDMNTEYKFKEVLAEGTFGDSFEGAEYQWDNVYDAKTMINEYRLSFSSLRRDPGLRSFENEIHRQRAYDIGEISNWLMDAGFSSIRLRDGYTHEPPKADTARVVFICR